MAHQSCTDRAAIDPTPRQAVALPRWAPTTPSAAAMERRKWTCVRTHSQAERWAEQNLSLRGYETYLPMTTVLRRDRVLRSQRRSVSVPLFGGYVFLLHDPTSSWTPIRETPGVRCVVRCGSQLAYTTDTAMRGLRGVLDGAEAFSAMLPLGRSQRAPGDAVSVRTGAFTGHPGVVLQVGREMVLVSMLVFGSLREVLVQADNLVEREA